MVIIMRNNKLDNQIKKGLQEQVKYFEQSADAGSGLDNILNRLPEETNNKENKEDLNMKHFNMKKAVIAAAVAVMAIGCVAAAAGKVTGIFSHSSSIPDYSKYTDLTEAEAKVGITTNAPESFSNGYSFYGIYISDVGYRDEEGSTIDSFKSLSVRYKNGSDSVEYTVQPRPLLNTSADSYTDTFEEDGITYYYNEIRSKWVTPDYEPTEEEKAQVEAGTLNIGYGASEISYSDSKEIFWEIDGQEHSLFCMDIDISKEEFIQMALEIK